VSPKTARRSNSKLDREAVIDAALRFADEEGLEAISFRRLADQFEVTPMALYWHFKDKDALLAAVADHVWDDTLRDLDRRMADPAASGDDEGGWAPMRYTVEALITAMRRHPALATFVPSRVVECDAGLSVTERTLAFLAHRGFTPSSSAEVARFLLSSAVMIVDSQPGAEIAGLEEREEAQRVKRIALASLPGGRYPHIVAAAEYLTDCDVSDAYFERAVDLVVAGVRQQGPPAASPEDG
jgi:TetR/AcrR family transcriptional regulator, tetracycline repressor protein